MCCESEGVADVLIASRGILGGGCEKRGDGEQLCMVVTCGVGVNGYKDNNSVNMNICALLLLSFGIDQGFGGIVRVCTSHGGTGAIYEGLRTRCKGGCQSKPTHTTALVCSGIQNS